MGPKDAHSHLLPLLPPLRDQLLSFPSHLPRILENTSHLCTVPAFPASGTSLLAHLWVTFPRTVLKSDRPGIQS